MKCFGNNKYVIVHNFSSNSSFVDLGNEYIDVLVVFVYLKLYLVNVVYVWLGDGV
jgi:hypothetical protein